MTAKETFSRTCLLAIMGWALLKSANADDFNYVTNNGAITIAGYTGSGGMVTIPNIVSGLPVTAIGNSAFRNAYMITSINIPDSVLSVGSSAFEDCAGLTNISLGNGITSLGDTAFNLCGSLPQVVLGSNLTNIGSDVFEGCDKLTNIAVMALNPVYSSIDGVLFNQAATVLIAYPIGRAGAYTIPNTVKSISDFSFYGSDAIAKVTIPNSVTNIGNFAFDACIGLTNVVIGNSVTTIGQYGFANCIHLTSIIIPGSVTYLASGAFGADTSLIGIYFLGNAPTIADIFVFYGDSSTIAYYFAGTTGWSSKFHGLTTVELTAPVVPLISAIGIVNKQFGFTFTGANNQMIVVETSTNLASGNWQPLQTNILSGTTFNFTDPNSTNYIRRYYRVVSH